jgi:AraC-like DNA-binding protein
METQTKLFFAANLIFIAVSLFSAIIKWSFRPKAYREHFERLFPGQFYVGLLFFVQIFDLIYLFELDNVKALRFANAFSLLLVPPVMLVICRKFFFPKKESTNFEKAMFVPAVVLMVIFLLRVTNSVTFTPVGRSLIILSAFLIFIVFFVLTVRMGLKIRKMSRGMDEFEFADVQDFSHSFANYVFRLPTLLCIIMAVNFICNNPWIKFTTDIVLTVITVLFVLFTLDPWKEIEFIEEKRVYNDVVEEVKAKSRNRLSDSRYEKLRSELMALFDEKEIFLTQHLTLDVLLSELSTNRNYLCETIARSGYKSFYDMVNSYRVKYAISLIKKESDAKMIDIAYRSGFASPASMNKAFVQQGMTAPSSHREILQA